MKSIKINILWIWMLFLWVKSVNPSEMCNYGCECVTDLQPKDCPDDTVFVDGEGIDNVCPGCVKKNDIGETCRTDSDCKPGLLCVNRWCIEDPNSCFSQVSTAAYPPTCSPDGKYAPVQCKGDRLIGRCFCADEKGKRIFGMAWRKDAEDMTCACSRKRAIMEQSSTITIHCTENGNYEKIQCDSGLCWCADEKTGDAISVVLPDDLISQLPCYDADVLGSQYTRLCESKSIAIEKIKEKLVLHGTTQVTMEKVFCDYDGTYGTYEISNNIAYCIWRDGSKIGVYQIQAGSNLRDVNCYCARDTKYFEESGKKMIQECEGNGSYMRKQQIDGQVYCVDKDGFPVTDLQDMGVDIDCTLFPYKANFNLTESKVYAALNKLTAI